MRKKALNVVFLRHERFVVHTETAHAAANGA